MASSSATIMATNAPPMAKASQRDDSTVTILLTTFAGLGLPRTLSLPLGASTTVHDLLQTIYGRLPRVDHPLIITTTSNKQLLSSNNDPISTLLSSPADTFLPLRLSARLCGGKGGFGSQLRAAGGRMSSRKNRNQQRNTNGSNRNLDGRRLRTVDAAKLLAEHLAKQPDIEKKEREERIQNLRNKIEAAESKEEQIKSGKMGSGQGRLDAEYVESKELAEEKTREAVIRALKEGMVGLERTGSESSMEVDEDASGDEDDAEGGSSESSDDAQVEQTSSSGPTFYGWDEEEDEEEDDDDDDDDDDDIEAYVQSRPAYDGKGKAKVI